MRSAQSSARRMAIVHAIVSLRSEPFTALGYRSVCLTLPGFYQVVVHWTQLRRWHAIGRQNTQRKSSFSLWRWAEHTAKPAQSADSAGFLFAGHGAPHCWRGRSLASARSNWRKRDKSSATERSELHGASPAHRRCRPGRASAASARDYARPTERGTGSTTQRPWLARCCGAPELATAQRVGAFGPESYFQHGAYR